MKVHESNKRSIVKALTFRLLILTADSFIVYKITQRYDVTLGVIVVSNLSSTLLYFLHERVWNQIHWERHKAKKSR